MTRTPFAEQLTAHLYNRRWSMSDLAERAGLHHSTISRVIDGSRPNPTRDTVDKIATALELSGAERTRLAAAAGYRTEPAVDPDLMRPIRRPRLDFPPPPGVEDYATLLNRLTAHHADRAAGDADPAPPPEPPAGLPYPVRLDLARRMKEAAR